MATHPDLKRAMERDGVPSLESVEEATGMTLRTLHRYRQDDESMYVVASRNVDEWVMGYKRMLRDGDRWTLAPGPGPAATDDAWNNLKAIDAYLNAKAEELVQRERALAAREAQVAALRMVLGREASGEWEMVRPEVAVPTPRGPEAPQVEVALKMPDGTVQEMGAGEGLVGAIGGLEALLGAGGAGPPNENDDLSGAMGLLPSGVSTRVLVMKLLDSLTLDRLSGDTSPVPDGKDVRFTLTTADIKFLDAEARKKSTSRNALVRAIVRKIREEVGEKSAA